MPKFMAVHNMPGATREMLNQMSQAAQNDPLIRGYRGFFNLTEGKMVCCFEAPDKESLASWFSKMNMPYESITKVELEGDRGNIQEA